jgi:hypothetical protein
MLTVMVLVGVQMICRASVHKYLVLQCQEGTLLIFRMILKKQQFLDQLLQYCMHGRTHLIFPLSSLMTVVSLRMIIYMLWNL